MKLTNGQILSIIDNGGTVFNKQLPFHAVWKLRKNYKKINDLYELIAKERENLGRKFQEEGKTEGTKLLPEYIGEYQEAVAQILIQENEIEIEEIPMNDIASSNMEFSLIEVEFLEMLGVQ